MCRNHKSSFIELPHRIEKISFISNQMIFIKYLKGNIFLKKIQTNNNSTNPCIFYEEFTFRLTNNFQNVE